MNFLLLILIVFNILTGIGQLVKCYVQKVKSSNVLTTIEVTADPQKVSEAIVEENMGITLQTLLPGMLFQVTVEQVRRISTFFLFYLLKFYVYQKS